MSKISGKWMVDREEGRSLVLQVKMHSKVMEDGWGGMEDFENTMTCFGDATVRTCLSSGILLTVLILMIMIMIMIMMTIMIMI